MTSPPENPPEVTVGDLPPEAVLLDVRDDEEWAAGHAPGARHIPLADLPARLAEIPLDGIVVCVCRSGGRSAAAARFLAGQRVAAVNLTGGMQAWQAARRPLECTGDGPAVVL